MTLPETDLLKHLNSRQKEAVTAPAGATLVLAGPGSGKTRVLTHRIAWLVEQMGIPAFHLLAVTFTNKAAREMESRVQRLISSELEGIWLGTFHAMCARLLRREQDKLPFKSNFIIMDDDDQHSLIKRIIRELNLDDKLYKPTSIHAAISTAKNNLILPQDFPINHYRDEPTKRVYERYQQALQASNAVDFDDLLMYGVLVLRENPATCQIYSRKFEHVLVDEFQDTNLAQYELLRLLASVNGNIFVVGDEDQSIYRWRGADYRNVLRFEQDYPTCTKILLEQNYRSTQNILDSARAVIDRNTQRTPKHLFSKRGAGEKIILFEAVDDHAEAAYVVDTLQQQIRKENARPGDFAVMYRTNAQSRLLEEAFLHAGLPYRLVGAQRFYGRREIKDLICFMRLVQNPQDEASLMRVINIPPRGIGDKTLLALQLTARQAGMSPGEVLLDLGQKSESSPFYAGFKGRGGSLLADVGAMLADWQRGAQTWSLADIFDHILEDTGYSSYINDGSEEGRDRWENILELRRLVYDSSEQGLTLFLENLALVSDQDTVPEHTEAPTLLTLHAAKGLEFTRVFITGLDDGMLPHSRSLDDPEQMAEERRLFYVGITRAKDRLFLVRAARRSSFGNYDYSIPSRFIKDIPSSLLNQEGAHLAQRSSSEMHYSTWNLPSPPGGSAPILEPRYKAGMRVKHAAWGEGMVIDVRLIDNDERIDVFFESVGFKRLLGSIAVLEIL